MSQHDYDLANGSGAAFRADINSVLGAIASENSGASAPTTTFAYMFWADTTTGLMKQRNAANSAWINLWTLATGADAVSMADSTIRGRAVGAGAGAVQDLNATQVAAVIGTLGRGEVLTGLGLSINVGSINDDAAASLNIGTGTSGKIIFWSINEGTKGGIFIARAAASANTTTSLVSVGFTVGYTTGILTGTTSTDGRVTFSAHTNGLVYIENRTGGTLPSLMMTVIGPT